MRLATAAALLAVWSGCSERDEPVVVPLDCTFDESATPATSQDLVLCALLVLDAVSDRPAWPALYRRSDDEIRCLAMSTTREQAQGCLGRTLSPGDACERPDYDPGLRCEGDSLVECSESGTPGGTTACVPVDPVPCDEIGASRCEMTDEGEVYVECSGPEPAHEVRVACHRLAGAVCDTERGGCRMGGSDCDELPEYGSGQCRDEGMLYCGFGVVREFDCTAIGFETCEQEVLPDDGGGLWLPPECVD